MPNIIDQIKEKIAELPGGPKNRLLIVAIIAIIVLIADIFFIFIPIIGKNFYLKSRIVTVRDNTTALKKQISMLGETKKRLEALKAEQIKYKEVFPTEEEVPVLLGDFSSIAGKLGIDIIAVKPVKLTEKQDEGLFHEVPIEISAKGGYHQMGQFINKLETLNKFMEIKDVEVVADKTTPRRHYFRILVSTYILKT
ncbi:MAG: type 4a pilus biogenesis protein PilO [Candidatus Omnitrophica bacterium]|nr:type 4a pilus biogenesis protein PilO [Candidatus Omnitrophota bacterium]